jgi:hypothetical protein
MERRSNGTEKKVQFWKAVKEVWNGRAKREQKVHFLSRSIIGSLIGVWSWIEPTWLSLKVVFDQLEKYHLSHGF